MRRTIILLLLAFGFTLAASRRADAQPEPWQPERLTAGWVFTPSVVVGTLWDSNPTILNEGSDFVPQWVTLVNPRGELDFNGRRTHFNVGYSGAFEAYQELNELNRYEQLARLDLRYQVAPRFSLFSRGGITLTPTTDRLESAAGAIPFMNVGSRVFDTSVGFRVDTTPHTQVEGAYRFQQVWFDRDSRATFDLLRNGHAHVPSARLIHQVTSRLSVGAAWEYTRGEIEGGTQTLDIHDVGGEVTYRVTAATTVSGGAGMSHLRASNPDLSTIGPAFRGKVEHHVGSLKLDMQYERKFSPSFTFGSMTANQSLSAGARLGFAGGRAYISGGLAYARTDPIEALGLGFRLDSTWTDASLGYHVARWLRVEGFYSGSHQLTTARGNFERTRIGIQFVTLKPVRIQ